MTPRSPLPTSRHPAPRTDAAGAAGDHRGDRTPSRHARAAAAEDARRRRGQRHAACRRSCALPYSVLDALIQHARVEKLVEVRGTSGAGAAGYRYVLTDLGRDRARAVPGHLPLRRSGAGAAGAVQRLRARLHGGAAVSSTASACRTGFEHLVVSTGMLDQLGPAVNSGKSLFLYGAPGNGKTVVAEGIGRALGGEMHVPLRDRRRRPDRSRCSTRSATQPHDGDRRVSTASSSTVGARPPVGAHPPAGRRGRRRADARDARPDVQPDLEVLRGADPDEGQRRRVRRRRLRPPADSAARPAEPLDRAARKPRRLPDAAHRAQVRGPVQRLHRLRDEPEAASRSPTKRSCAASRTRSSRRTRRSTSPAASSS